MLCLHGCGYKESFVLTSYINTLWEKLTQLRVRHLAQAAGIMWYTPVAAKELALPDVFLFQDVRGRRQRVKDDWEVRVKHVYLKTARCWWEVNGEPKFTLCSTEDEARWWELRFFKTVCRFCFASGEGVFTETNGVHRESLCNNNFHVQGCGNVLIICVKKEFEIFKSEGWGEDLIIVFKYMRDCYSIWKMTTSCSLSPKRKTRENEFAK